MTASKNWHVQPSSKLPPEVSGRDLIPSRLAVPTGQRLPSAGDIPGLNGRDVTNFAKSPVEVGWHRPPAPPPSGCPRRARTCPSPTGLLPGRHARRHVSVSPAPTGHPLPVGASSPGTAVPQPAGPGVPGQGAHPPRVLAGAPRLVIGRGHQHILDCLVVCRWSRRVPGIPVRPPCLSAGSLHRIATNPRAKAWDPGDPTHSVKTGDAPTA